MQKEISRRCFISKGILAITGLFFASSVDEVLALPLRSPPLCFSHTHTGEYFEISPLAPVVNPAALKKLNYFLRDFRTNDIYPIDPSLLTILQGIRAKTGSTGIIEVISGYRSQQTNRMLRKKSTGVAKRSLHLTGHAIDVRFSDIKLSSVRDVAISLKRGGVGYYRKSNFVHLDTGRFRIW